MVLDDEDRIFVTGELQKGDYTDYATVGYYIDGSPFGQVVFEGPSGLDDRPSGITIDMDGNLIVTGQTEEPGGHEK